MEFSEHLQFPLTRRMDCVDLKTCLMRMMSDGDVATISVPEYTKYIFNELGYQSEMMSLVFFIYGSAVFVFTKGNTLVSQINILKLKSEIISESNYLLKIKFNIRRLTHTADGFGGLVVSMLASGTQVYGFKPGRSRWIFRT